MTYRLMYDSTNPELIPASAAMVAGYINGSYAWQPWAWARFPHAIHVTINVNGNLADGGDVLDVERYDATPEMVPAWVKGRKAAGARWHAVYCSLSKLDAVRAACQGQDVPDFGIWVAEWTGQPHEIAGTVGTQFASLTSYDLSAIYDATWHPAVIPPAATPVIHLTAS